MLDSLALAVVTMTRIDRLARSYRVGKSTISRLTA
jgi:hypothetical protein